MQYVSKLSSALLSLGGKRLIVLAGVLLALTTLIVVSFNILSKPVRETLYSSLDAEDVNLIGAALSEVGIAYDVNVAGDAVLVDFGRTAEARMILAQRGLPRSDKSGYELFDKVGSLGLTSFMQHVTQVRALEGELIRTIQQLEGIRSARVHLALRPSSSFRNKEEQPSASVVIRTAGEPPSNTANAIRNIVGAAIPGLRPEHVSVMTTDGTALSTSNMGGESLPDKILDLQSRMAADLQTKLERTLAPLVGYNNLRVSVAVTLNGEKREFRETKFDPDSKVERSSRTVKSLDQSTKNASDNSVSVEKNIPQEVTDSAAPKNDTTKKESKEEAVNYEVNSQETAVQSGGYEVEKLSFAVVLNRQALAKAMGDNPDEAKIKSRLKDIESLAISASGADTKRGDLVQISAIDFVSDDVSLEALEGPGLMDNLSGNIGNLINAAGLVIAVLLIVLLGLRPALRMVLESNNAMSLPPPNASEKSERQLDGPTPALEVGEMPMAMGSFGLDTFDAPAASDARTKLSKVVEIDVDRAAQVLKQWLDAERKDAA